MHLQRFALTCTMYVIMLILTQSTADVSSLTRILPVPQTVIDPRQTSRARTGNAHGNRSYMLASAVCSGRCRKSVVHREPDRGEPRTRAYFASEPRTLGALSYCHQIHVRLRANDKIRWTHPTFRSSNHIWRSALPGSCKRSHRFGP